MCVSVPTAAGRFDTLEPGNRPQVRGRLCVVWRGSPTLQTIGNFLLDSLPADVRRALDGTLERVHLGRSTISEPGDLVEHIYFPIDAVFSVVTVMRDGTQIEVLTVGREGLTGAQSLLDGGTASQLTMCQVPGEAYRIDFDVFARQCERFPVLRDLAQRYLSAQLDAMAQAIACNRLHYVNERCARWLLMTHDRVGRDEFPLTHEMLATMLGVRRAGVSVAAAALQLAGCISYTRGRFTIVDRGCLEAMACECYFAIDNAFKRRQSIR
jgi:CRP-like cAMP-binding protein